MMFVGAKFCSHCGARADRTEVEGQPREQCPRCHVEMNAVEIGNSNLRECPRCEGIWADATSLQQICADREKQAAVIGMASPPPRSNPVAMEPVSYIACPGGNRLMHLVHCAE